MKRTSLVLLSASLLTLTLPLPLPAKEPATPSASVLTMERVNIEPSELSKVVEYLQLKTDGVPGAPELNVVIPQGMETMIVPALRLRNVSPTDVLAVVARLLRLELEPVIGPSGDGRPIAFMLKETQSTLSPPLPATPPALPGATNPPAAPAAPAAPEVGVIQEVATNTLPPAPETVVVKVFAVAALTQGTGDSPEAVAKDRDRKYQLLINGLESLCEHYKMNAELKTYNDMDILVARSSNAETLALVGEAIAAMQANVSKLPHQDLEKAGLKR